jgi:Asp/Glu/hydantoin racemase
VKKSCYALAPSARAAIILLARIVLLNPNTTAVLTDLMVEIAREVAAAGLSVEGLTAPFGPPLITCDLELDEAAQAVLSVAPVLAQRADAVIVSAFGDPVPMRWPMCWPSR